MTSSRPRVTLSDMDRVAQAHPPIDDRAVHQIALDRIAASPRNPRVDFGLLDELAASLEAHGLLQPIVVRRTADTYEVIAGHRRLAAAAQLNWPTIACVVRDAEPDEAFVLTLVENLQRDDLSAKEEAAGLEVLLRERGWSTRQVAESIKRSHTYVSKRLRVFDDPIVAPFVLNNRVTVSAAEEVLTLGPTDRGEVIAQAAQGNWGRSDVRSAVQHILQPFTAPHVPRGFLATLKEVRQVLRDVQPGELSPAMLRELQLIFREGRDYEKRLQRREAARGRGTVMPTIAPSGRVFVDEDQEEPETVDSPDTYADVIATTPGGGTIVLDAKRSTSEGTNTHGTDD